VAVTAVAVAEVGRRRGGGRIFSGTGALFAPLWLPRAVCGWLAVGARLPRGGVDYAARTAAHSDRHLRATRRG
jgi:hypothetical protein